MIHRSRNRPSKHSRNLPVLRGSDCQIKNCKKFLVGVVYFAAFSQDFPNAIIDGARLIKQNHQAAAFIMRSGERFRSFDGPWDRIGAPSPRTLLRSQSSSRQIEHRLKEGRQMKPLRELGPILGSKLNAGVRRDDSRGKSENLLWRCALWRINQAERQVFPIP